MPINGTAQQNNHILGEFVHCIVQEDVETCFAMVIKSKKRGICEFKFFPGHGKYSGSKHSEQQAILNQRETVAKGLFPDYSI